MAKVQLEDLVQISNTNTWRQHGAETHDSLVQTASATRERNLPTHARKSYVRETVIWCKMLTTLKQEAPRSIGCNTEQRTCEAPVASKQHTQAASSEGADHEGQTCTNTSAKQGLLQNNNTTAAAPSWAYMICAKKCTSVQYALCASVASKSSRQGLAQPRRVLAADHRSIKERSSSVQLNLLVGLSTNRSSELAARQSSNL